VDLSPAVAHRGREAQAKGRRNFCITSVDRHSSTLVQFALFAAASLPSTYDPRSVAIPENTAAAERMVDYLDQFVERCRPERTIHAVLLLGSAAGPEMVDVLSDLDLMVVTSSPRRLSSSAWLTSIAPPPLFTWTYPSPVGGQRVGQAVYDGPLVVDLAFVSSFQALLLGMVVGGISRWPVLRRCLPVSVTTQVDSWLTISARGTKVLFDRAGLARRITAHAGPGPRELPARPVYLNTVYSGLGLLLWESKQLVRGELWMALETVDHQVKQCLLTMIE
jgi:hypothetical protein